MSTPPVIYDTTEYPYDIEDGKIATNFKPVYMIYIREARGKEALFLPKFIDALVCLIASQLAPKFATGSAIRSDDLLKQYLMFLEQAKQADADAGNQPEPNEDSWVNPV
jgi:hypothetical protein